MNWRNIVVCFLLLLSQQEVLAQQSTSNVGTSFAVGFMENALPPSQLSLQISSVESSVITLFIPQLGSVTFGMDANKDTVIDLPIQQVYVTLSEMVVNRGVRILSTGKIGVIASNHSPFSSDKTSLVPIEYLPNAPTYLVNTYRGTAAFPSSFLIMAVSDSTQIEVVPSTATRQNKEAGRPFRILLNAGQSYMVQALDTGSLRGSEVRVVNGCQKLLVFSGGRCSQVSYNASCSGCDHLFEQDLPTSMWGRSFQTIPAYQTNRYQVNILALEDQTTIQGDLGTYQLNRGEGVLIDVNRNTPACFSASHPISAMQLLRSGECNAHDDQLSDPSMVRLIPTNQWTKNARFSVQKTPNLTRHYVTIISENAQHLRINGQQIPSQMVVQRFTSCNQWEGLTLLLDNGGYRLTSDHPFYGYQYGYGRSESYMTAIACGYEQEAFNFSFTPEDFSYCSEHLSMGFFSQSLYHSDIRWHFGDGREYPGDTVYHTFNGAGTYKIRMVGAQASGECLEDSIYKEITLHKPPELHLGGDTVICNAYEYIISPEVDARYSRKWMNGSTAPIYIATTSEMVWLKVTNEHGCEAADSVHIVFDDCKKKVLHIPNVFTPGNDGYNDFFVIEMEGYRHAECRIYNRWGREVYKFDPRGELPWNGGVANDANQPCADGTYLYVLDFTDDETGVQKQTSGTILLIRER
jgi:gliding motility-associated-like protein